MDFELVSSTMALTPPWALRYRDGLLNQSDLDRAMTSHWNVVDKIAMLVRRV